MGGHRKASTSPARRRMGMGIATAALGVTALGAVASQAAAARYESPTAHAASAASPDSGNAVDGHQLKGSGKAGRDLIDGAIWLGKQIFGVDDEPPLNTPTHSLGGGITKGTANQADYYNNQSSTDSDGGAPARPDPVYVLDGE